MNSNYSKLYSSQLDNGYDISIRSSWGLNVSKGMVEYKMLRGSKLEG